MRRHGVEERDLDLMGSRNGSCSARRGGLNIERGSGGNRGMVLECSDIIYDDDDDNGWMVR